MKYIPRTSCQRRPRQQTPPCHWSWTSAQGNDEGNVILVSHTHTHTPYHQIPPDAPHDKSCLTGFLSDINMWPKTKEALLPVIAAQGIVDWETNVWDRLPSTAHWVILTAITLDAVNTPKTTPPTIYRFLYGRNTTELPQLCILKPLPYNLILSISPSRSYHGDPRSGFTHPVITTTKCWTD